MMLKINLSKICHGKISIYENGSSRFKYKNWPYILNRALTAGAFGVPAFQVNDGPLIFGQDRLNVVADLLCGWTCSSKL